MLNPADETANTDHVTDVNKTKKLFCFQGQNAMNKIGKSHYKLLIFFYPLAISGIVMLLI